MAKKRRYRRLDSSAVAAIKEQLWKHPGSRHGKIGDHMKWRSLAVDRQLDKKMVWFSQGLSNGNVSQLYRQVIEDAVARLEKKYGAVPRNALE